MGYKSKHMQNTTFLRAAGAGAKEIFLLLDSSLKYA